MVTAGRLTKVLAGLSGEAVPASSRCGGLRMRSVDGDTIHAVILGSAVNNDGSDKIGFTAPSERGQASVIAEALNIAGISPESITYIEAHGTGTPLGDPIEIAALTRVFRRSTQRRQFCALGSIKSNFGHLGRSSGSRRFDQDSAGTSPSGVACVA